MMKKEQDPKMLQAVPCEGSTSINTKAMPMRHILVSTNHVRKHAMRITFLWHFEALMHV